MSRTHSRTPLALGWEAARANALPGFILQAMMLALLVAYYVSPATASLLNQIAEYKRQHGFIFVVLAAIAAGALLPELFVVFFFQSGRVGAQNFRNLAFTIPTWAIDGILVDLMYRSMATWFGDAVTVPVVFAKICVDQLGYNPFFAAPGEVLVYEWKNTRISWASLRRALSLGSLPRQNRADSFRDLGGLDSADGDHLFVAARVAISALQSRANFLGVAAHLHDEPLRGKNRSRRADRAFDLRIVGRGGSPEPPAG